ncbi:hypothetical protein [Nonlabens sp. Asnod2-A12]|uniref:hypothetical protein n=1 Tax=Nonlabens sp. Asnod2-A12 TaxID=3160578 RepID=UPI003864C9F3
MKRILFGLLILIIFVSCENTNSNQEQISDQFKIEFLNEILSDTIHIKILNSKSELISNFSSCFMAPPVSLDYSTIRAITGSKFQYTDAYSKENRDLSELELISNSLVESDTSFIQKQRKSVSNVNLNQLSNYGFRILDVKGMSKAKFSYNDILQVADSLNQKTGNYSFLKYTIPIFNKEKNLAYIRLQKSSSGEVIVLEKIDNRWKKKLQLYKWVE